MSPWPIVVDAVGWSVLIGVPLGIGWFGVSEWRKRSPYPAYRATANIRFGKEVIYVYGRDTAGNYLLSFKPKGGIPWVESPEKWASRVRRDVMVKV